MKTWTSVLVAMALLIVAESASGLPRYTARYGQDCNLCHVNPTGGGMRGSYASQFLIPNEMVISTPSEELLAAINPQIAPQIAVGADARMLYVGSDEQEYRRNFFLMQADIYLDFQLGKKLRMYFDIGKSGVSEIFGLAHVLPSNGYVKLGQFTPDYGWRRDDHTAFTRERLGFAPPGTADVGIEAGIYPGSLVLTAGVWNGSPGAALDTNDQLAGGARGAVRFQLGDLQGSVGGSVRIIPSDEIDRLTYGPLAYLHWWKLSYVGEVGFDEVSGAEGSETTGFAHSHELSFGVRQGLEILATMDMFDPDIDLESGAEVRWGGGLAAFLNPFVRLDGMVWSYGFDSGPALEGVERIQVVLQAHLLY